GSSAPAASRAASGGIDVAVGQDYTYRRPRCAGGGVMATSSPAGPAGAEVLAAQDGTVDLSIALPAAPRTESAPPSQEVRAAIRLGWSVAEVRGRHWWRGQRPPTTAIPVDPPYALP